MVALAMLDLSAAFDTLDHERLESRYGVTDKAQFGSGHIFAKERSLW